VVYRTLTPYEPKIADLQEQAARHAQQMMSLPRQLAEANSQVQAVAVKAVEGASGAKTLTTVQEIAIEQARQAKLPKHGASPFPWGWVIFVVLPAHATLLASHRIWRAKGCPYETDHPFSLP